MTELLEKVSKSDQTIMNYDRNNDSSPIPSVNPRLYALSWAVVVCGVLTFSLSYYLSSYQPKFANKIEDTLVHTLSPEMFSRETLQRDYEEIFATPFRNVKVGEYTNSKAGHGLLFAMTLKSTCPLQLKDPKTYKMVPFDSPEAHYGSYSSPDWFAKNHAPWMEICLHKQKPEPVIVWFNRKIEKNTS